MFHFFSAPKAPVKKTEALMFGSMVHHYIQERKTFDDFYHVFRQSELPFPENTLKKKENADYYDKLFSESGKEIISEKQWEDLLSVTGNVIKDKYVTKFIEKGNIESSIFFNDSITGLPLKVRPDNHFFAKSPFGEGIWVVDIKTTEDASPKSVAKAVANFSYEIQAAMQVDGLQAFYDKPVVMYIYLFVEKKFPYSYGLYSLDLSNDIDIGRVRYQRYLQDVKSCLESGVWPSYDDRSNPMGIIDLKLPPWFYSE
jgi:exodeoxyribonuclease VIII